jgi:hypothetical protein
LVEGCEEILKKRKDQSSIRHYNCSLHSIASEQECRT